MKITWYVFSITGVLSFFAMFLLIMILQLNIYVSTILMVISGMMMFLPFLLDKDSEEIIFTVGRCKEYLKVKK